VRRWVGGFPAAPMGGWFRVLAGGGEPSLSRGGGPRGGGPRVWGGILK
jgi:hypothetical protein